MQQRGATVTAAVSGALVGVATIATLTRAVGDGVGVSGVRPSLEPLVQAALALVWWLPAAALARRRSTLPFWWLALIAASAHGAAALAVAVAPDAPGWLWAASWLILVELPVIGAVVQLFPTGRALTGWRPYLAVTVLAGVVGVITSAVGSLPTQGVFDPDSASSGVAVAFLAIAAVGGVVPLGVRVRRTVGAERRAVIWMTAVVAVSAVVPPVVAAGGQWGEVAAQCFTAGQLVLATLVVLRHRVWGMAPMLRRSLHHVVAATDTEGRRIRRELHYGVGGGLTSIRLKVDAANRLVGERPDRAQEMLDSVSGDIGAVLDEVRRLIDGLRPRRSPTSWPRR